MYLGFFFTILLKIRKGTGQNSVLTHLRVLKKIFYYTSFISDTEHQRKQDQTGRTGFSYVCIPFTFASANAVHNQHSSLFQSDIEENIYLYEKFEKMPGLAQIK